MKAHMTRNVILRQQLIVLVKALWLTLLFVAYPVLLPTYCRTVIVQAWGANTC